MSAIPQPVLTAAEYLRLEELSKVRHEYDNGDRIEMSGGTLRHADIISNLRFGIRLRLRNQRCRVVTQDLKVRILASDSYVYPDVVIQCGEPRLEANDTVLLNPEIIIEVLSPSTESYDRGEKFDKYRTLESLQEYVLVWPSQASVLRFTRMSDGVSWKMTPSHGLGDALHLHSLSEPLPLAEIYSGITFDDSKV